MQRPRQNGENGTFHHYEMGVVDGRFSSGNFENHRGSSRKAESKTLLHTVPENDEDVLLKDDAPCRENSSGDIDGDKNEEPPETSKRKNTTKLNRSNRPGFGMCHGALVGFRMGRGKRLQSSVNPIGEVHVNRNDMEEHSYSIPKHQQHQPATNQENAGTASFSPRSQGCCCFVRFISLILAVIFVMSATSLTMVILIISGNMVRSAETATTSAKGTLNIDEILVVLIQTCCLWKSLILG